MNGQLKEIIKKAGIFVKKKESHFGTKENSLSKLYVYCDTWSNGFTLAAKAFAFYGVRRGIKWVIYSALF
jgi:hypothetical protein